MIKFILSLLVITNVIFWVGYFVIQDRTVYDLKNDISKYTYKDVDFNYDSNIIKEANKLYVEDSKAEDIVNSLNDEQKVSQLFFVSPSSDNFSDDDSKFFQEYYVGGVYFGPQNITSEGALTNLIESLNKVVKLKPFYSTDQEGASVIRLWWDKSLAGPYYLSTNDTPVVAYYYGKTRTEAFKAVGLNLNFAPVMDLQYDESYDYVRSLSIDAKKVAKLGGEIIKGQQESGVLTAMKYFPGTGSSKVDPKKELVEINFDKSSMSFTDLFPFKENFNVADAIITSHAKYPKIDSENQVTFSKTFITNILKEEYGYKGLIITDDLNSPSITRSTKYKDAVIAGHDMLYTTSGYEDIKEGIRSVLDAVKSGEISSERLHESVFKIVKFKQKYSLTK